MSIGFPQVENLKIIVSYCDKHFVVHFLKMSFEALVLGWEKATQERDNKTDYGMFILKKLDKPKFYVV